MANQLIVQYIDENGLTKLVRSYKKEGYDCSRVKVISESEASDWLSGQRGTVVFVDGPATYKMTNME